MRYRLRYIDGIKVPATQSMTEGSALHAIVEAGLLEGATPEVLRQASASFWDTVILSDTTYASEEDLASAKAKVMVEAEHFLDQIGPLEVYCCETYLASPLINPVTGEVNPDITLHGYTDLLVHDGVTTRVVDIKTSTRSPAESTAARSIDLSVYSYLTAQTFGWYSEVPTSLLYLVRSKTPKVVWQHSVRSMDDFAQLYETVEQVYWGITNNLFWRSPSMLCASCPYEGLCFENCHADRKVA